MAGTVYALVVGINDYRAPLSALYGCRNDVEHLRTFLEGRLGTALQLRVLVDDQAARQALIDAFRSHLGQAGAGDVALFCFSGHGSEEPAPPEFAPLEPSGRIQTLMCWDSGRRVDGKLVRGLSDKELALLLDEVAAGGAHVAVILDCCHSGSGTRDEAVTVRQWLPRPEAAAPEDRDVVAELAAARGTDEFLPGVVEGWSALQKAASRDAGTADQTGAVRHVALSACRSEQVAKEQKFGDQVRGAFSVGFLDALQALGPTTSYRALLAAVRSRVERSTSEQTPVLYPVNDGGPADLQFLTGAATASSAGITMTRGREAWEVDAGSVHGLHAPEEGQEFRLACLAADGSVAGVVRVLAVTPGRSTVEPVGWTPADVTYRAVVVDVPLPPATVSFDTGAEGASGTTPVNPPAAYATAAYELVRSRLRKSGPGGTPSPFISGAPAGSAALALRVAAFTDGYQVAQDGSVAGEPLRVNGPCLRILRADGTPVAGDVSGLDEGAADKVVARLEHVARWEMLRSLSDTGSALRNAVRLEVVLAEPGETAPPADRTPLVPEAGYQLAYRAAGDGWEPPTVFLQLRNTSERDLYVTLLDFNDRYGFSPLLPTEKLVAGHTRWVLDGTPITVQLPGGRAVEPGAAVKDWLQVIVSDAEFETPAPPLPALDERIPPPEASRGEGEVATSALDRLLGRASHRAVTRGDTAPTSAPEWAVVTIPMVTEVPR